MRDGHLGDFDARGRITSGSRFEAALLETGMLLARAAHERQVQVEQQVERRIETTRPRKSACGPWCHARGNAREVAGDTRLCLRGTAPLTLVAQWAQAYDLV